MYARRAQEAMTAGNFPGAILALEMVCSLNPRNHAAALALANLWQVSGRAAQADAIYERLMAQLPERRTEFGRLWYRALLARADFDRIKRLAPEMLRTDGRNRAAWLHALFFAARQTADPLPLNGLLADTAGLPDWCVLLLTIEHELLSGNMRSLGSLTRVWADPGSPYVPLYQADRLVSFGRHREALSVLDGYAGRLPADEAGFLRLRIYSLLGWDSLVETEAGTLLAYPMRPQLAAQFSAFLLRHPHREVLARFADRFVRDGPRPDGESFPAYAAVLLAAARCGDTQRADYLAGIIRQHISADLRAIGTLGQLLRQNDDSARIDRILPAVPLPTEVVYALLERYHRPAP
jgi:tetratricopeptide (TPR) repeat protein